MNELVLSIVFIVFATLSWFIVTAPTKTPDEMSIGFTDVLIVLILAPVVAFVLLVASAGRK